MIHTIATTITVIITSVEMDSVLAAPSPICHVIGLLPRISISFVFSEAVQEMVLSLLIVFAMLCAMPMEPNVAMNGGIFSFVTMRPLNRPKTVPRASPVKSAMPAWTPAFIM